MGLIQIVLLRSGLDLPYQIVYIVLNLFGLFFTVTQTVIPDPPSIRKIFTSLPRNVNIVFPLIVCLLLIGSLIINYLLFYNKIFAYTSEPPRTTPTQTIHASPAPTSTTSDTTPTPTVTSTVTSTATSTTPVLVRPGNPFLDDPMMSQNSQEQWDVINQPYASCGYSNGGYDIKVPANTVGGCSTNTSTTIFTNFIYEINMKIVSGVTNVTSGTRGAGIMFRYENQNGASNYGISFQQNGSYFMFVYNKQISWSNSWNGPMHKFSSGSEPNQFNRYKSNWIYH